MKVKKNDKVYVISGKEKGKSASVIAVNVTSGKIKLENMNMRVKNIKPRAGRPGERVKKEAFMDVSNVLVVCPTCSKPTRIGYKEVNGKKMRACKQCPATFA